MSNSLFANNLANWLAHPDQALGLVTGKSLFVGRIRGDKGNAVLLKPSGGTETASGLGNGFYTLQVLTRSTSYDWAHSMAWQIYDLINDRPPPWRAGSSKILLSKAVQPPFFVREDERQQCLFSHNYRFSLGVKPE